MEASGEVNMAHFTNEHELIKFSSNYTRSCQLEMHDYIQLQHLHTSNSNGLSDIKKTGYFNLVPGNSYSR